MCIVSPSKETFLVRLSERFFLVLELTRLWLSLVRELVFVIMLCNWSGCLTSPTKGIVGIFIKVVYICSISFM